MADTGGKKSKKKPKAQKISLNDFLTKDSGSSTTTPIGSSYVLAPRKVDWADETEDVNIGEDPSWSDDYYRPNKAALVDRSTLPTAPKASLSSSVDTDRLPKGPPYTAFIGNLPYDVEQEDVMEFFRGQKVKEVRIPRETDSGRIKGFGYVEFEDLNSMISGIALNEESMKNRKIRVDVADSAGQGEKEGYNNNRPVDQDPDDWRARKEPTFSPARENDRYGDRGGGFDRGYNRGGFDRDSRDGFDRDNRGGNDRDNRGGYDRDSRGGYGRDSRGGYGRDSGGGGGGGGFDSYNRGGYERDNRSGYDRGGDDDSDRRRGFGQGWGGRDRDNDRRDNYGSRGGGGGGGDYERRDAAEPAERPKLQLKPRTAAVEKPAVASSGAPKPSIFGNAKPVDTATREQEIEKRLERERQREEEAKRQEREERESERTIVRPTRRISDSDKAPRARSDSSGSGGHRERKDSSGPKEVKEREQKTSNSEHVATRERSNSSTHSDPNSESGSLSSPRTFGEAPSENPWAKRTKGTPEKDVKEDVLNSVKGEEEEKSQGPSGAASSWGPRRGGGPSPRGRGRGRGAERDERDVEKQREKPEKVTKPFEEPKQPVFSQQSKFSLLAEEGDDGFDEIEDPAEVQS